MDDSTTGAAGSGATINVRGLGQIMLRASSVENTLQFYKEALGFVEAEEQMLSPGVTVVAGDASIYITEGGTPHAISNDRAEFRIALIARGVRDAYDRAVGGGLKIVDEYDGNEHFASFSIADPDGVIVEVWGAA